MKKNQTLSSRIIQSNFNSGKRLLSYYILVDYNRHKRTIFEEYFHIEDVHIIIHKLDKDFLIKVLTENAAKDSQRHCESSNDSVCCNLTYHNNRDDHFHH